MAQTLASEVGRVRYIPPPPPGRLVFIKCLGCFHYFVKSELVAQACLCPKCWSKLVQLRADGR